MGQFYVCCPLSSRPALQHAARYSSMRMLANMSSAPRSRLGVMAHGTASS
jgi:hypothetical protein